MLTDIQPIKIPITLCGRELYLRYSLNSRLYFEHYYGDADAFLDKDMDGWKTEDVIHMLRAGLLEATFEENEGAINRREWDSIKPSFAGMGSLIDMTGLGEITRVLLEALLASIPPLPEGTGENFQNGAN